MRINTDNYELFVIDYLDGKLDSEIAQEMSTFLLLHPDIATEIDDLNMMSLQADSEIIMGDNFLKTLKHNELKKTKTLNEENYEHFFVAQLEGDLDNKEKKELEDFLHINPNLENEYKAIQSLHLKPDSKLVFTNRESLKKKRKILIPLWSIASSIAAMMLLTLWVFTPKPEFQQRDVVAKINSRTLSNIAISKIHNSGLKSIDSQLLVSNISFDIIEHTDREPTPQKIILNQKYITIEDEKWKAEILFMQSYAFDKTELYASTDWRYYEAEKKPNAFRLISSLLWKTTKGHIKNISNDVISDDIKIWQTGKLDELTEGYFSYKSPPAQE